MTAAEVMAELEQRGIVLQPNGDRLQYKAPVGALTPELRQLLVEHKAVILNLIQKPCLVDALPIWHAREVARCVETEGVCVFWSDILEEMIAFVKDEACLPGSRLVSWPSPPTSWPTSSRRVRTGYRQVPCA